MRIALIWSQTSDGSIGDKGELLHRFSDDLARFSSLTRNNIVLMGRKTWESLPDKSRPLPKRVNLVLTRDPNYKAEGAIVFTSMEEALIYASSIATWRQRLFVIGGAEIYKQALPYATDACQPPHPLG